MNREREIENPKNRRRAPQGAIRREVTYLTVGQPGDLESRESRQEGRSRENPPGRAAEKERALEGLCLCSRSRERARPEALGARGRGRKTREEKSSVKVKAFKARVEKSRLLDSSKGGSSR